MKKIFLTLFILMLTLSLVFSLVACGDNSQTPTPPDSGITPKPEEKPEVVLPTAAQIIAARKASEQKTKQEYDFDINLNANIGLLPGFPTAANANYKGKYRFDSTNDSLYFHRTTSGALLYDSNEYIYTNGSNRINLNANQDDTVKKISIIQQQEEQIKLLNIPFVGLLNSLEENNLSNIVQNSSNSLYKYKANLVFATDNSKLNALLNILGNLGTNIDIKNVIMTNPQGGVELEFNLSDDKSELNNFRYSLEVTFPVLSKNVTLKLTYEHKANNSNIIIPSTDGLVVDKTAIAEELLKINSAIANVKNSDAYSVDMSAINSFDPGWNKLAIDDKYISRLYKNKTEDKLAFNHSYEYKAHSDTEGKETYKFTIGNLSNDKVFQILRHGANRSTELQNVTVDTQFDYIFKPIEYTADEIDCIRKVVGANNQTDYVLYLNKAESLTVKDKIVEIINSNEEQGVVDVNNYFDNVNNTVKESEVAVSIANGLLLTTNCKTILNYYPTGGDNISSQITLTNSINIEVNKNLYKAKAYSAPSSDGNFVGLGNVKYYIL